MSQSNLYMIKLEYTCRAYLLYPSQFPLVVPATMTLILYSKTFKKHPFCKREM